jgi:hypothetical protein
MAKDGDGVNDAVLTQVSFKNMTLCCADNVLEK